MSENENTRQVSMTDAEMAEFRAFREAKARAERDEAARRMRKEYTELVDGEIAAAVPELLAVSENIATVKRAVLENFKAIIDMKSEIYREKGKAMANFSHTFTSSDGRMRITLGQYLQPTPKHAKVEEFVTPKGFGAYGAVARAKGFLQVAASPLTRSSYHAGDDFAQMRAAREAKLAKRAPQAAVAGTQPA